MACNNSAVLDVLVENKEIPSIIRDCKDFEHSSASTMDNSFPPSLDSFNSLQENLSELKIDDGSDLSVIVDNPQKVLDTLETYVTFRVLTKTARIEFEENEYIVRRRYNDFVWLRQKLVETHPYCIVPPLPAKHSLVGQLDRYSRDFVLLRMKALNVFTKRIAQHPILSCNEYFKIFVTAKQGQFNLYRKQKTNPEQRLRMLNTTRRGYSRNGQHLEFDQIKNYLFVLHERLSCIDRLFSRVYKEKRNTLNDLSGLHPVFTSWSFTEPDLAGILRQIGKAVEITASAENNLTFSYPVTVSYPIKELLLYIDVVQEALKKREVCQQAYENSVGELNRRHSEKDRLLTASSSSSTFSFWKQSGNDDRLLKLDSYIPELVKRVDHHQDSLECANECLRSDIENWQREKNTIMRKILQDFVSKQVEYHTACANAWEQAMQEFSASYKK